MEAYLEHCDIYEVDKEDYDAYFYRLPKNEIIKITPREGWSVFKDTKANIIVCGIYTENVMAMPANRYFIFNFLEEERLGDYKYTKHIHLSVEEYEAFVKELSAVAAKSHKGESNNND